VSLVWTRCILVEMVAVFAGRAPRCKFGDTEQSEMQYRANLDRGISWFKLALV
jgi:hypothetical protein